MKKSYAAIFRNFIPFLLFTGIFTGCKIIDPAEEIPSYLHIDSISFTASGLQGSSSSKITEAWIFVDDQLIGGFELPCTVPILQEGTHHVLVRPGIWMNGQPSTRAIYPFYKGWEGDVALTRAQVTHISPAVAYFPGIDFTNYSKTWVCGFEPPGTNFIADPLYHSVIKVDSIDAFEGHSGHIKLNQDTIQFVGRTSVSFPLNATTENYLEMNYKCDTPFTVGIVSTDNVFYPWVTIGASATWNKIYIRLTDVIATAPAAANYYVYIGMFKPADYATAHLDLDNLKFISN